MALENLAPASGRMIKEDGSIVNIADIIAKGKYKYPLNKESSASISAGSTQTFTILVDSNKRFHIKSITITKGADITVNYIKIDDNDTGLTDSFDSETEFGALLTADSRIDVNVTNSGAAAEDLTVLIKGYMVDK